MFNSYEFVQTARDAYYEHLFEKEGQRVTIEKDTERFSDTTWAWPSNLGRCPRQTALQRHEVPMTHPPTPEEKRRKYWYIQQGVDAEAFIVEACVFAYPGAEIFTQVRLNYNEHGTSRATGKADMLVMDKGTARVFEIKRPAHTSRPTLSWIYQTLFYGLAIKEQGIANTVSMHIVIQANHDVEVWDLEEDSDGYLVRNARTGELWDSPENDPLQINMTRVISEIVLTCDWLKNHADFTAESRIPIEDPINDDRGWQCITKGQTYQPKIYKTERNAERYAEGQTTPMNLELLREDGTTTNVLVSVKPGIVHRNCNWLCHTGNAGPFYVWPMNLIEDGKTYRPRTLFVDWRTNTNEDVPDSD